MTSNISRNERGGGGGSIRLPGSSKRRRNNRVKKKKKKGRTEIFGSNSNMIIRSNSPLLGKKVYVNCQKSWHIFSRYSKVHPPVYRSIHSELRFMKRGWNTFSPCPPCSHRNNDARKIFLFPLFYYIRACTLHVSIYIHTHTRIYISSSFFSFTYEYTLRKSACRDRGKGQDRSIVKRRMKADLYCAREVNKAERIVTAASRYIVIYLNIIFPQRIEGIIVFAHITPYYQSSLVDVSTRDLLFFTYPWFSTSVEGFIYFFFFFFLFCPRRVMK